MENINLVYMIIKRPSKNIEAVKKLGIYCWSIIGLLILLALAFYILFKIKIVIFPLIVAAGIAFLLSPFVNWMGKKMKRGLAIFIAYIVFTGILFTFFFFTVPMVYDQFRVFILKIPVYITRLTDLINYWIDNSLFVDNIERIIGKNFLHIDPNAINQYFGNLLSGKNLNYLQGISAFTRSFLNLVITFIIGPVLGIYILKDAGKLRALFIKILPPRFKHQLNTIIDRISNVGGRYIRGQIFISIIVGCLCTLILFLLKVDFPILLGFIAGISNLIPFLGPIIGVIPAALTALSISPIKTLLVVLLFIGVQQLDSYVISPNVMKFQVGVHPAIVMLVLIAVGTVFGPVGLLIAVPLTAMLQAVLKYYLLERKNIRSR
ncbi:MAG TPA: AI-2E family transporter [Candidatus Humimicrobiaceae bacterium]